ncbi:MAG: glycosyltransferase family 4 protein [Vulcanimicrobiaceae bacterium]
MKIAYVTTYFPYKHEEQFFEAEVRSLSRLADVAVIPTRARRPDLCYHTLGSAPHFLGYYDLPMLRGAWAELRRDPARALNSLRRVLVLRSSPRSRLVNLMVFPKALALADEVRRLGVDHIHAQWITTPTTVAYLASQLTGIPYSATAHQHDVFAENLVVEKLASAAFIRVISDRNRRHLEERLPPELRARCTTIHLGVEVPDEIQEPPERVPRILCAARMCSWKGHRFLLAALAQLRDQGIAFTCDLAGDGELRDEVAQTIASHGLGDLVRMVGKIPHTQLMQRVATGEWDIFALASTERPGEHEGIPVAVMEAMAAGIPVVATRTGSLDELVDAGSGFLVEHSDAAALADAIGRLLSDRGLRRRTGQRGRARVCEAFETSRTTAELFTLIERATPNGVSQPPPPPTATRATNET